MSLYENEEFKEFCKKLRRDYYKLIHSGVTVLRQGLIRGDNLDIYKGYLGGIVTAGKHLNLVDDYVGTRIIAFIKGFKRIDIIIAKDMRFRKN